MERRSAIIAAAGASLTLLAGAAAIGINTQLVDASDDDGVGEISPVSATDTPPDTIYVDDPAGTQAPAPARDDDDYEDHEDEDEDEDDDRYEDHEDEDGPEEQEQEQEHEYEGAEDDD